LPDLVSEPLLFVFRSPAFRISVRCLGLALYLVSELLLLIFCSSATRYAVMMLRYARTEAARRSWGRKIEYDDRGIV
jgi:hypothetical protein